MIVVTGWPRSGTSLLMQLLIAGGLNAVHEDGDTPRPGNPGGVWEHPVAMHRPEWVLASNHRDASACVKILWRPLQRVIGMGFPISAVIYTDRLPEAALASQQHRTQAGGRLDSPVGLARLKADTTAMLEQARIPHRAVPLRDLVDAAEETIAQLAGFLDPRLPAPLAQQPMAAVPDQTLLHH